MSNPVYTEDWFTNNIPTWNIILKYLNETFGNDLTCLEVGTYEGRSALYLLENFVGNSVLTVIDKFFFPSYKKLYFYNITNHPKGAQVKTMEGNSFIEISKLLEQGAYFDFIYLDAGKTAGENIGNLILAERILKVGGILVVDDFTWNKHADPRCCPNLGITSFKNITLLCEVFMEGYQLSLKKIKDNSILIEYNL
jgi:predicted O-methyltransferase YrrM